MKRARWATGLVLAGLIGGSAWWLCWVPYQPARMLHAIPGEAVAVTAHRNLAGRQATLLANPVTGGLIAWAVGPDQDAEAVVATAAFQTQLMRFGTHEWVAAYVPRMGPLGVDSVVMTSWLGARSHWLRWGLRLGDSAIQREPLPGGRSYWFSPTDLADRQGRAMRFAVMFEEGLAIGCLSADPHNIRLALECYDRRRPSVLDVEPRLKEWLMDADDADRGWGRAPGLAPVRYAVTTITSNRFAGRMHWAGDWREVSPRARLAVPGLFGSLPYALATVSRGLAAELGGPWGWGGDLATLLTELDAEGLAMGVFGEGYGGRLRGVRIPAVVAAVPCRDRPAATALLHRIVHRVGLREGLDLSVEPDPNGEPRIYSIATGGRSFPGPLPAGERPAFCVADEWLLLSSSRLTLERLLERRAWAAGAGGGGAADAGWLDMDLGRGEKSLRNALAAYWLIQVLGGESDPGMTRRLGLVRRRLEHLAELGRLELRAYPEEDELAVDVEAGK